MKNWLYKLWAQLTGTNPISTPTKVIVDQLNERRPLPVGVTEFEEWSDRIIAGAMLPADKNSQKFALSAMIMQLGPHESSKEDAYFIHGLRKVAANQVASAKMVECKEAAAKAHAADDDKGDILNHLANSLKKPSGLRIVDKTPGAVTPTAQLGVTDAKVLDDPKV